MSRLGFPSRRKELTAADDGHQGHEHGQEDGGQKAGHDSEDYGRDVVDPSEERHVFCQVVYVADDAYHRHGDAPEQNHGEDEGAGQTASQRPVPRVHLEVLPDDLAREDAPLPRDERGGLVVDGNRVRRLCCRHRLKLDEACIHQLFLARDVGLLLGL